MDAEQMAQINQLRGMYGGQAPPGFKPTQGMPFQGFQPPQHAALGGPSLGGGGQGGGGGGGGGGGMGEIAKSLGGILQQAKGGRQAPPGAQPAGMPAPVAGGGPAGPPVVGTQQEMGPFASQAGGVGAGGVPAVNAGPQAQTSPEPPMPQPRPVQPYNAVPPPMTGPQSDRALPPAPMAQMTPQMQGAMPQLMKAGGELPEWLFRMPRMTGAIGL